MHKCRVVRLMATAGILPVRRAQWTILIPARRNATADYLAVSPVTRVSTLTLGSSGSSRPEQIEREYEKDPQDKTTECKPVGIESHEPLRERRWLHSGIACGGALRSSTVWTDPAFGECLVREFVPGVPESSETAPRLDLGGESRTLNRSSMASDTFMLTRVLT